MNAADSSRSIRIEDPDDPRLADFRDLNHSDKRPDASGTEGIVIAEGNLVVSRLIGSACRLRAVVGFPHRLRDAPFSIPAGVPVYEVERDVLAAVVGFDMHRGLLAAADRPAHTAPETVLRSARTVVVMEGVGDHENIGAIFRSAASLGVDAVLLGSGCADPFYRRSVRVSMGHVLRLPWARLPGTSTTWQRSLGMLRDAGFRILSLTPNEHARYLPDALLDVHGQPWDRLALLVGAEGPGLTEHAMRATDERARIPMAPGTDSLNVATSAAVALYERGRSLTMAERSCSVSEIRNR